MRLILARHGNTFAPGETVVWVGARSDLPLSGKGPEQAKAIGDALSQAGISISKISSGPLQRTRETASLAASVIGYDPDLIAIDQRLIEIDYGLWEGKTSNQICAEYGEAALSAWEQDGKWPVEAQWLPSQDELMQRVGSFIGELADAHTETENLLVVTSNGLLRAFGQLAGSTLAASKMATGHLSITKLTRNSFEILAWNQPPSYLSQAKL